MAAPGGVRLRPAGPADHAQLAALSGQAFAVSATPLDPALVPYLLQDPRRVVGEVVDGTGGTKPTAGGRLVAHAGAWSFGQWFGGGRLACAGVAGVAVAPDHRGSGLGTAVLTELLRTVRGQGDVLASLFPMNHRFYRSLGFGPGSVRRRDRVPTRELAATLPPDGRRDGRVTLRPVTPDDVPGIEEVVVRRARQGTGLLDHEARYAARLAGGGSAATYAWVAVDPAGAVVGYVLLDHRPAVDPDESFALSVTDLAADDVAVEARCGAWSVATPPARGPRRRRCRRAAYRVWSASGRSGRCRSSPSTAGCSTSTGHCSAAVGRPGWTGTSR